jgi:hypothetical protein
MIQQNLQATANQQDDEEKIDVMSDSYPKRETLWMCGIEEALGTSGHRREAND